MRIGSLFSGYGGLELGIQQVLGGNVAWHSEIEPAPSRILAHHWPDVPNLGDVTTVNWSQVEPVDVICGGSPCQDLSHAGKRLGMKPGTRSGLWASMCDAIDIIRPSLVVWENVRGALSAAADSAVEPCPICVGDERESYLRALGRVVGDLSELGYDSRWCGLRAADVGAPHGRFRIFLAAWSGVRHPGHGTGGTELRQQPPFATGGAGEPDLRTVADADGATGGERRLAASGQAEGGRARPDARGRDRASAPHPGSERHGRREDPREVGRVDSGDAGTARERERAREVAGDRGAAADADTQGDGRHEGWPESARLIGGSDAAERGAVDWGTYAAAIHRWERTFRRVAPPPTEPGRNGAPRLSPRFVEWLMGLPEGHVTAVPGITRNDQLKALGNGVVPQQAAAALAHLLTPALELAA